MIVHNKFVFAHLTKTGGTFIRQYLSDYISDAVRYSGGRRLEKHDGLNVLSKFILNGKFTFGCIRNPLSFYVSLWGANTTKHAIKHRPRRKIWFKNKPEMKHEPTEFIKFLCEGETGKINYFDFDLMKKLDIGVLTYRYLCMYYDHKIFKDPKWKKNHEKYKLVKHIILVEDGLAKQLELTFRKHIFKLDSRQKKGLYKYPRKNQSKHKPFMEYYDEESLEYIKHKERFIFKLHYKEKL